MERQRILDHGYILPMVTSRGPLCTAGFVRGTTEFMIDLVENPEGAHKLIDLCTRVVIDWLKAQHKAMGDTVEGIFILDDIVGFVNEEHYLEFAHPYLKRICDAFPARTGSSSTTTTPRWTPASTTCPTRLQHAQLGQAARHSRSEAAGGQPDVPDGQCQSAGDRGSRHA
jgi:hypothetical protein